MRASFEHAATPMLQQLIEYVGLFVRDTALCNRPFASLWLANAYEVPAGVWLSCLLELRVLVRR